MIELVEGETTLGRSHTATVMLKDASISRVHAALILRDGRLSVRDLHSSNGTYVNGRRLMAETTLADGDHVTLGETKLVVHALGAPEAIAALSPAATVRIDPRSFFCSACGGPLPEEALSCPSCGHAVGSPVPARPEVSASATRPPAPPAGAAPRPDPASVPLGASLLAAPISPAARATPPPAPTPAPPRPASPVPAAAPPPRSAPAAGPPPAAAPAPRPASAISPAASAAPASNAPPRSLSESRSREALPPLPDLEVAKPAPRPAAASATRPRPAAAPAAVPAPALRPAGFWIRLLAVMIDGLWMTLVSGALLFVGGWPPEQLGMTLAAVANLGLTVLVPILGWALFGATPGKRLCGLRVVVDGAPERKGIGVGKALLRWIGYAVSSAILGIGFLMIAFDRDKRGLHDRIAGTRVVRR